MYENNLCPGEAETAKRCGKIASMVVKLRHKSFSVH